MRRTRAKAMGRALLATAAVLSVAACAATGGRADEVRTEVPPSSIGAERTTAPADATTTTGEEEPTTTTTSTPKQTDLTVDAGMTSTMTEFGTQYTSAGALVSNPNEALAAYDVEVLFNLLGPDGAALDTESETVPYIPPGTTVPVAPMQIGYDLPVEPTSIEAVVTADLRRDEGWDGVEFMMGEGIDLAMDDPALRAGSFGSELTAQVTNPSEVVAEWAGWNCVFRRGGDIVGGESGGIMDRIPPGVTVAVNSPLTVEVPAEEIVCRATA